MGLATESHLVSRRKIVAEMEKYGKERLQQQSQKGNLLCIKFDGRKDLTLQKDGRTIQEKHSSVISEPVAQYLDHIAPESGKAVVDLAGEIFDLLQTYNSVDSLLAVGADGTATNTGNKGGVMHLLELHLKCHVHWIVCMLHFNELPH